MIDIIKLVQCIAVIDTDTFQKAICVFHGKTQTVNILGIYGISFNPPKGSFGVAFSPNGYEHNMFALMDRPDKRFKGLEEGELCVGNYLTGKKVLFKKDGTIHITGNTIVEGTVTATDFITASVLSYNGHKHPDPQGGLVGVPQ